ncbi:hypothetical protein LCGC14_1757090, partial [marine sediment metagenome]
MLRFEVYRDGAPAEHVDLSGAYVFGQDAIPVRADLAAAKGQIRCLKRTPGACGLALLWEAGPAGRLLLSTCRPPDRKAPYNLNVELVRAQVMRLIQKREDWALFDDEQTDELNVEFDRIRGQFVESLKCEDPAEAARIADAALADGVTLGEKMALYHADVFLRRRRRSSAASRVGFGCVVDLLSTTDRYRRLVAESFDVVSIPLSWKRLAAKERSYRWAQVDDWINWAVAARRIIHAGPLVSFDPADVPEWLYIWEHDYEALREMIYEHLHRVLQRYESKVRVWKVVSGLHAYNSFNLSFEQIMELTRLSCSVAKKLAPQSVVLIELVLPWGEYYARNQRTIPPLLYADMAVQSGIKFDAFGVQLYQGMPQDGMYVRDLMQVSALLDEFVGLGVPLHITGVQVPSDISADAWDGWGGKLRSGDAGHWHVVWNARLQAEALQAFCRIAISKPFVESVTWRDLADYEGHYLPHGGLCRNDLSPKTA